MGNATVLSALPRGRETSRQAAPAQRSPSCCLSPSRGSLGGLCGGRGVGPQLLRVHPLWLSSPLSAQRAHQHGRGHRVGRSQPRGCLRTTQQNKEMSARAPRSAEDGTEGSLT